MFNSSHHRRAVARSVERSLNQECELHETIGDGRGGQTWSVAHTGVGCMVAQDNDPEISRESRREVNRSLYIFLFAKDAPVQEHHRIVLTGRFGNERTFAVSSIGPLAQEDAHLRVRAEEITD